MVIFYYLTIQKLYNKKNRESLEIEHIYLTIYINND